MCLFSDVSAAAVKDEPPDNWDDGDQEGNYEAKPMRKDKDLDFLFQEVVRDRSLDDYLRRDLQSKKSDRKYEEMLVSFNQYKVKYIHLLQLKFLASTI